MFLCDNHRNVNVFDTLTLKHFLKKETFFKKLVLRFLVESTKIENAKSPYMLRQIKWGVQNRELFCQ